MRAGVVAAAAACLTACSGADARPPSDPVAAGGVTAVEVDGGADYFARWPGSFPTDPGFFPIGVWFESVTGPSDTATDRAAGLNTYVQLTSNSDLGLIHAAGMYAVHGDARSAGPETTGWLLADEVDMWAGAGDADWTGLWPGQGEVCSPAGSACGYSVQRDLLRALPTDDRRPTYANYGKGVAFWLDDDEASRFVLDYGDVVSADTYWFTDRNICGISEGATLIGGGSDPLTPQACHRASNYGRTVERVRELAGHQRPVWGFVELGHPASEDDWPTITPEQVSAAVWSSLIHGARGIVYFNHSFGGDHPSQHVLREEPYRDVRAAVTEVNRRITQLAPVLNAPTLVGLVPPVPGLDVMVKEHDGALYVFAASTGRPVPEGAIPVCGHERRAEVLFEKRSLTTSRGRLVDEFADGNAVHVYRVPGADTCRRTRAEDVG